MVVPDQNLGGQIIQTSDGGYTVSGRTNSYGAGNEDLYLLKLDVAGNVSWSTTVGSVGPEYAGAMVQTPNGDYLLSGTTQTSSLSYTNIYIAKINSAGTLLWTKEIGGPLSEWVSGMINSTDGGYILTGVTYSYGEGNEDVYLVKLDSAANLMWTRTVGGPFNDTAEDIIQTADGGYITVGSTISFGEGAFDMYVVKFNAAGAISWTKTIGNDIYNSASSVIQTADGYIICGITETDITGDDIYLVKLDDLGNTCSTCLQSTGGLSGSGGTMIASTGTTGTGVISGTGGNSGSGGTVTSACQTLETAEINAGFEFTAYPNPTSGKLILSGNKNKAEVKVYTITGAQILNQKLSAGTTTLDLSTQPNGVYFILITSDDKTHFQKIILQK